MCTLLEYVAGSEPHEEIDAPTSDKFIRLNSVQTLLTLYNNVIIGSFKEYNFLRVLSSITKS
jgi:hypothetical protein